jgi:exodeoxyribonuclease VII small subunit
MPRDQESTTPEGNGPRNNAAANSTQPASFEAGLAQLTEIVSRLEAGGLGLSESIDAYERGVVILKHLHEELSRAEARVRLLTGVDEDGQPIATTLPLPAGGAAAAAAKPGKNPAPRGTAKGRSAAAKTLPGMDDPSGGV